jgi:glutamate-1-semialdehyde aminotransferase
LAEVAVEMKKDPGFYNEIAKTLIENDFDDVDSLKELTKEYASSIGISGRLWLKIEKIIIE